MAFHLDCFVVVTRGICLINGTPVFRRQACNQQRWVSGSLSEGDALINKMNAKEVIEVIVQAVDTINPILKHHHRRTAIIAYHLGTSMQLPERVLTDLVIAASLHDIGAMKVEDKEALCKLDVLHPYEHSIIGAGILSSYQPFQRISAIIRNHHVHYNQNREAFHSSTGVPLESYILHLADRIDILMKHDELALNQVEAITSRIQDLSGTLFAPEIVQHFLSLSTKESFWFDIEDMQIGELMALVNMNAICIDHSFPSLETLIFTLSKIIDYKSSFTVTHSVGVAHVAYELAKAYGFDDEKCLEMKLAGYLHDIGKIAIPSEILHNPSVLDATDFNIIKSHPYYTNKILKAITGFEDISYWVSYHHEKLDLSGYPYKPEKAGLITEVQLIIYADVFTALCEDRPYRKAYHWQDAMQLIEKQFVTKVGEEVYQTLRIHACRLYQLLKHVQERELLVYQAVIDSIGAQQEAPPS